MPPRAAPTASLQATLLGAPRFCWHGDEIAPRSKKTLALLACLTVRSSGPHAGREVGASRDELAELLWQSGKTASVRQALYELRSLPGSKEWLLEDDGRVQVAADSDVAAFEQAVADDPAAAVALYTAPLLAGFAPPTNAFEEWLEVERARLEMLYLEALEQHAAALERAGDFAAALTASEQLLARDPLNESAYQSAMRLSYLLGDAAAALAFYRACEQALRRELDTAPLAATQALAAAIERGEPLSVRTAPEHLPEPLLRLLQALALSEAALPAELLARALEREPFALAEELAELERRRLLDAHRHLPDALRADTLAVTPRPIRRLLHRRLAEALAAEQGEGADPRQLGRHWLGAHEPSRAAPYLLAVARTAVTAAAPDATAAAFRAVWVASDDRVSDELRFDALMLLEAQAERTADNALQAQALTAAEELAWELQDDAKLFLVRLKRSRQQLRSGEVEAGLKSAEQALEIAERTRDPLQLARAHNALGGALFYAGRLDEAYAAFAKNQEAADPTERYRALNNLGAVAGIRGELTASYRHFGDALTLARQQRNLDDIIACLNNVAGTAERLAAYDKAVTHLREGLGLLRRTGDPRREAQVLVNLAVLHLKQGAFGPAWNTAEEALELAQQVGDERMAAQAREQLGEVARLVSAYDEALPLLEQALGHYHAAGDERKQLAVEAALALTRFEQDPHGAGDAVEAAVAALEQARLLNLARWFAAELAVLTPDAEKIRAWRERADALVGAGAPDNAHLQLLSRLAELRATLLEGAPVTPPALDELAAALEPGWLLAPFGYLLLGRAGSGEQADAWLERAANLLAEQGAGLPKRLCAALEGRLAAWEAELP